MRGSVRPSVRRSVCPLRLLIYLLKEVFQSTLCRVSGLVLSCFHRIKACRTYLLLQGTKPSFYPDWLPWTRFRADRIPPDTTQEAYAELIKKGLLHIYFHELNELNRVTKEPETSKS